MVVKIVVQETAFTADMVRTPSHDDLHDHWDRRSHTTVFAAELVADEPPPPAWPTTTYDRGHHQAICCVTRRVALVTQQESS